MVTSVKQQKNYYPGPRDLVTPPLLWRSRPLPWRASKSWGQYASILNHGFQVVFNIREKGVILMSIRPYSSHQHGHWLPFWSTPASPSFFCPITWVSSPQHQSAMDVHSCSYRSYPWDPHSDHHRSTVAHLPWEADHPPIIVCQQGACLFNDIEVGGFLGRTGGPPRRSTRQKMPSHYLLYVEKVEKLGLEQVVSGLIVFNEINMRDVDRRLPPMWFKQSHELIMACEKGKCSGFLTQKPCRWILMND